MQELQITKTLPREEAHHLLTELMHDSFDVMCSPLDNDGNLTITWPASLSIGKQLNGQIL